MESNTEWSGRVVPTGSVEMPEGAQAEVLLKRYLQLNAILTTAEPVPDAVVEELISKAEAAAGALTFDEQRIAGEWRQVFTRTAKEGTASQKALSTDKTKKSWQNFMRDDDGKTFFRNIVQVTKQRCQIVFDVAYEAPAADDASRNRLASTIATAGLEVKLGERFGWQPLRIPLPLKGEGWLDVTYLSEGMRITRGNRGGVFVHMRPELLTREAAEA